jgi:HEAT repeat protein
LRTAESPAERASAARSLGLVRDDSGTPHLVAALEDSSPEVRRAAVESLAEVRDPSAVAPLEALRDREKNRKVPTALIQHAIEASVVGRTKVEPPSPLVPSYETTPLTADDASYSAIVEPSIEAAPPLSDEFATQALETVEPLPSIELDHQVLLEAPDAAIEATPAQLAEAEIVAGEIAALPYGDVPLDASEEIKAPATTEESVQGLPDSTTSEWVDIDLSRPSKLSAQVPPPSAPAERIEEVLLEDSSTGAVVTETSEEVAKPIEETVHAAGEPPLLPFVATEAVIAGATLPGDERGLAVAGASDKEIDIVGGEHAGVSAAILRHLASEDDSERAGAVEELGRIGGEDSFREVSASFDDPSPDVRNAAARALFSLNPDRAASFTRALREASPERRRNIGAALSSSGLATEAIGHLMGESREKTYDAFSLLFLMAKAGEVQPLMRAVEEHPNNEVRLAVVKLLALSGQQEILPAFRRLAVRGSLPTEVRSAVMEAIYQISSQSSGASS